MAAQSPTCCSIVEIQSLLDKLTLANLQPTFTLFPKLPPELHLKILEDALPIGRKGYRFVKVIGRISAPSRHSKEHCWFILGNNAYSSDVKDIGLLGENKETRNVYLRYFNKALRAKGEGLIRYHENDAIFVSNIDLLMLNRSTRSVITEGSRIKHVFDSCTNIAAPISYFINYHDHHAEWFGDNAHVCPLTVVSKLKELKTVGAVLSEGDAEKFSAMVRVTQKVLRARWWCYLSHTGMQMNAFREEEEKGSGKTTPELLLLGDDGEVLKGKKCTEKKCFNE